MSKRFVFILNSIVVVVTLFLGILAYLPPVEQGLFAGSTLLIPVFLVLNFLFIIYWLLKLNKRLIISTLVLIVGYKLVLLFFGINVRNIENKDKKGLKIATYNAHYFNSKSTPKKYFGTDVFHFFEKEAVDIIVSQESIGGNPVSNKYPFFSNVLNQNMILSKHKIIRTQKINSQAPRSVIYFSDILFKKDTIRVYNVHFLSFKFPQEAEKLKKRGVFSIYKRINTIFKSHQTQTDELLEEIKKSPYKTIVCGDFNNNAYSYQYRQLIEKAKLKDTFTEAGTGFGTTFDFKYFPTRIDFILVPESTKVQSHKVHRTKGWSDHFPVITTLNF